jgi:hypothetical protein
MPLFSSFSSASIQNFGGRATRLISNVAGTTYFVSGLQIGGGGGGNQGGGGGGGWRAFGMTAIRTGIVYTATVGAGGVNYGAGPAAGNGGNTQFELTGGEDAWGGTLLNLNLAQGGGASSGPGRLGGSGGGGDPGAGGGAGIPGQGNDGAGAGGFSGSPAGGGGGAGGVGDGPAFRDDPGNGGASNTWPQTGATAYAGGGGGGAFNGTAGNGGGGGAGNGGRNGSLGNAGIAGSGGGGGGGYSNGLIGHSGGSGTIILSYVGSQRGTGGTVSSASGNTYHTFITTANYVA